MVITANKKHNAEERLNSISGLQIQFDKLKKETGLLCGAIQPQVAHEAPLAARLVQPNVLADKNIGSEIEPEKDEQNEQFGNVLEEKLNQIRQALCHFKWQTSFDRMYLVYTKIKLTDSLRISWSTQISLLEMKTEKL